MVTTRAISESFVTPVCVPTPIIITTPLKVNPKRGAAMIHVEATAVSPKVGSASTTR